MVKPMNLNDEKQVLSFGKTNQGIVKSPTAIIAVISAVAFLLLGAGFLCVRGTSTRSIAAATTGAATIRVTVAPGDTLWSLSQRYGNPNTNIEDRVDALAEANNMRSGTSLISGQRLLMRVENPIEVARLQTHLAMAR